MKNINFKWLILLAAFTVLSCVDEGDYSIREVSEESTYDPDEIDGDGLTNEEEMTGVDDPETEPDPNGEITDPENPDSDGDGMSDGQEAIDGTDPNDEEDNNDTDGDGLTDDEEMTGVDEPLTMPDPGGEVTDPEDADTDDDGMDDGEEAMEETDPNDSDTDDDGMTDGEEIEEGTDPTDSDSDGDGMTDGEEMEEGTNPMDEDTDDDGMTDGEEMEEGTDPMDEDTDDDGMTDGEEMEEGTDPMDEDTDDDGMTDGEEMEEGTDPMDEDTDDDGMTDGEEMEEGTDPMDEDTDDDGMSDGEEMEEGTDPNDADGDSIIEVFGFNIDLSALANYANQDIPNYIDRDNTTAGNDITDEQATLGRVLFYDVNLSSDNTISCASCHKQEFAFGDTDIASQGVNGTTLRHSMRLINARFAEETNYFWDERANTLEEQTTMPIQDHIEMGFSGEDGAPDLDDLLEKLSGITYYQELFEFAYGDTNITEERLQECLSQFIRSIQSFDSRYDIGRAQVRNDNQDFPNFTDLENLGKQLFMDDVDEGGANCATCHMSPEFDIDAGSDNNGVIGVLGNPNETDLNITRSPTLRDMANAEGRLNGPFMHDGSLATIRDVIEHYNDIDGNNNLDNQLGGRNGQNLNLTENEMNALEAFMLTLSGNNVYTDTRWSDPFLN